MPTNEQIIKEMNLFYGLSGHERYLVNLAIVATIKAVALEPKQEHDHVMCPECQAMRFDANRTGKASIKRFDVDALAEVIAAYRAEHSSFTSMDIAQAIADNFAAPEREEMDTETFINILDKYHIKYKRTNHAGALIMINDYFALQPAPEHRPEATLYSIGGVHAREIAEKSERVCGDMRFTVDSLQLAINQWLKLHRLQTAHVEAERCPQCGSEYRSVLLGMCGNSFHRERVTV